MLACSSLRRFATTSIIAQSSSIAIQSRAPTLLANQCGTATQCRALSVLLRLQSVPRIGTNTKVVCTIGPSTDQEKQIAELVENGMRVARLNFSHAGTDYTYPETIIKRLRATPADTCNVTLENKANQPRNLRAVLVDTKGPEIRTGPLQGNAEIVEIEVGDTVELTIKNVSEQKASGDGFHRIMVDYQSIAKTLKIGGQVLLDDGLIALEVTEIDPKLESVTCKALNAGPIKKNKGVNLPGCELDLPALTDKDMADLKWACEVGADFVAASFIRTAANVRSVIAYLSRCIAELPDKEDGRRPLRPLVISKIESKEGVDNFHEILAESDGIMVARGDLGVEIPYHKVFAAQKMMVEACNGAGKPVIVATQMLDSMIRNPRPTRAEVTDVGTAVLDGADAVMLSGETAAGKYAIQSAKAMSSIVWEADRMVAVKHKTRVNLERHLTMSPQDQELDALALSACKAAAKMDAKLIMTITKTGRCARILASHRPTVPILAFCTDPQVGRRLQLHRCVKPLMLHSTLDPMSSTTRMGLLRAEGIRTAKELGFVRTGDRIVMFDKTTGKESDMHEVSHNLKIVTLRDS